MEQFLAQIVTVAVLVVAGKHLYVMRTAQDFKLNFVTLVYCCVKCSLPHERHQYYQWKQENKFSKWLGDLLIGFSFVNLHHIKQEKIFLHSARHFFFPMLICLNKMFYPVQDNIFLSWHNANHINVSPKITCIYTVAPNHRIYPSIVNREAARPDYTIYFFGEQQKTAH